jgi:hypothetical protein
MMPISDTALKDLHKLATTRVEAAMNTVVQLLENDEQVLHLSLTIIANIAQGAALHMHETMQKPDGSKPSMGECYCRVLSMLAAVQGVETTVLSEDEAKKAGIVA